MSTSATKIFKKGDLIIKEGDSGEVAFVINKGHVEVKKEALRGEEVVIARLGPGQIFGEMCLFDNTPRSASVYAIGDLEVSVIKKDEFLGFVEETPPQFKVIIELLLKRLRQTSSLVTFLKLEKEVNNNHSVRIEESLKNLDFPV